jgi:hypothetical protein
MQQLHELDKWGGTDFLKTEILELLRRLSREAGWPEIQEVAGAAPEGPAGANHATEPSATPQLDPEAHAIALLFKEPSWDIQRIAATVGVCRQSLYKMPKFRVAAEGAGKIKPRVKPNDEDVPRGHKAKDGHIEAVDPRQRSPKYGPE